MDKRNVSPASPSKEHGHKHGEQKQSSSGPVRVPEAGPVLVGGGRLNRFAKRVLGSVTVTCSLALVAWATAPGALSVAANEACAFQHMFSIHL